MMLSTSIRHFAQLRKTIEKTVTFFVLIGMCLASIAQSVLSGKVVDATTGEPVPYAYVVLYDAARTGTLTNEEGNFLISGYSLGDTLEISHISFQSVKLTTKSFSDELEVQLEERQYFVSEVNILANTGDSIFQLVKKNLEKNHGVGPVLYEAFSRSFQYDKSKNKLFMIQELFSKVSLDTKNKAKVNFERARSRAFVDEDSIFSYHLVFELMFPFEMEVLDWKIWDKKFLKSYTTELSGTEVLEGRTLLQLELLPRDSLMASYTLLIDQETYAIVRKKRYFRHLNGPVDETFFKEVNGLWHVAYLKSIMDFTGSSAILDQVIILNIAEDEPINKEYKGYLNIFTSTIVNWDKTLDPWDHPFWQTYRNIPLPAWIQAVMGE